MFQAQKGLKQTNTVGEEDPSLKEPHNKFDYDNDSGIMSHSISVSAELKGYEPGDERSKDVDINNGDSGAIIVDLLSQVDLDQSDEDNIEKSDKKLSGKEVIERLLENETCNKAEGDALEHQSDNESEQETGHKLSKRKRRKQLPYSVLQTFTKSDREYVKKIYKEIATNKIILYLLTDEDGDTLLHSSIIFRYVTKLLKLILNVPHPVLLNSMNPYGQTPLHLSIIHEQFGITRLLVISGANVNFRTTEEGNTALHLACKLNYEEGVNALIDPICLTEQDYCLKLKNRVQLERPQLDIKNNAGQACIHIAAFYNLVSIFKTLVAAGADIENKEALSGNTPLMIAISRNNTSIIDFLLNECNPNLDNENYARLTAYQIALSVRNYDLSKRMIQLGAIPEPFPSTSNSENESDDDETDVQNISSLLNENEQQNFIQLLSCNYFKRRSSSRR